MTKTALFLVVSAFASNAFAGQCLTESLLYGYSLSAQGEQPGDYEVGRLQFDGNGNVDYTGVNVSSGVLTDISGRGTYSVGTNCMATITINEKTGVMTLRGILDSMDNSTDIRLAYAASMVGVDGQGNSLLGIINRMVISGRY